MLKTSFHLPADLYYRLQIASETNKVSVSTLMRKAIEQLLEKEEQEDLDSLYAAMEEVAGVCKDNITDAAITIDEVLYGEHGAWRGRAE